MLKEEREKNGSEETGYGPEVHEALDQIPYPNDESAFSINSPGYPVEQEASSSRTPAPRTPVFI